MNDDRIEDQLSARAKNKTFYRETINIYRYIL